MAEVHGQPPSKRSRTSENESLAEKISDKREFDIIQGYRDFANVVTQDRIQIARVGDVDIPMKRLEEVETLFENVQGLSKNKNAMLAQDSKAMLNISELLSLSVSNVKLDESGRLVKLDDILNGAKRFMLQEYFEQSGLSESNIVDVETNDGSGTPTDDTTRDDETGAASTENENTWKVTDNSEEYKQRRNHSRFLSQFERFDGFHQFNWFKMGILYENLSAIPLTTDHMLGPLDLERKSRKQAISRRRGMMASLSTAERVTKDDLNASQGESTPSYVKKCYKILKNKSGTDQINLFKFIIDPKSYAKSVENLFYTSFLIKEGRLVLEEDNEGYPAIRLKENLPTDSRERELEKQRRNDTTQNHIIFQMDIPTWRKLINKFNITEAFITS